VKVRGRDDARPAKPVGRLADDHPSRGDGPERDVDRRARGGVLGHPSTSRGAGDTSVTGRRTACRATTRPHGDRPGCVTSTCCCSARPGSPDGSSPASSRAGRRDAPRWGIAGRDVRPLERLPRSSRSAGGRARRRHRPGRLAAWPHRTRVLATTVGPYARLGVDVARACAEHGTHYADITGEEGFVRTLERDVDPIARRTGPPWSSAAASTRSRTTSVCASPCRTSPTTRTS
jgi:hypothetical protein